MLEKTPSLILGAKICGSCRKELAQSAVESKPLHDPYDDLDNSYACQQGDLVSINECLKSIGETPVIKKKLVNTNYQKVKLSKIKIAAAKALLPSTVSTESIDDGSEILGQLKEKFHASIDHSQKLQILTVLPKSWSVRKEEGVVSNYMARKAKDLVKDQGILSSPNPKHGCT